jgi:photosystem II stability/assembly factor-like uncharacterized protein
VEHLEMSPTSASIRLLSLVVLTTTTAASAPETIRASSDASPAVQTVRHGVAAPPIVENRGQFDPRVRFAAAGGGVFFTADDIRIATTQGGHRTSLWLTFVGGRPRAIVGGSMAETTVSYLGSARGPLSLRAYHDVIYRGVWSGVDARIRSEAGALKYEFVVQPGASPSAVRLRYAGADEVTLDSAGSLVIQTPVGPVTEPAPVTYQIVRGHRVVVPSQFAIAGDGEVRFEVERYDTSRPLVIDPMLVYSTYLGSSGYDAGNAIAVDSTGAAYVAGTTHYSDFPTTPGAYQTTFAGGAYPPKDVFVAKINAAGTRFDYVTYLGGSGNDEATGIAVDESGYAFVTGVTYSSDFPVTPGAYRTTIGVSRPDGFVTKLNTAGSAVLYSTFLGSNALTTPAAIAVAPGSAPVIVGETWATNLPSTVPGLITGAFTNNGKSDGFVMRFSSTLSAPVYSTYVGAANEDAAKSVAVDGSGYAYVAGWTRSPSFPISSGAAQPRFNAALFESRSGSVFAPVNNGLAVGDVSAIAIDPQQNLNVYVGTRFNGLFRSADGGQTWQSMAGAIGTPTIYDVKVNPGTPSTVVAGTQNGLYVSTDSGFTWWLTNVRSIVKAVAFSPSNPSFAYAVGTVFSRSVDGGATWMLAADMVGWSVTVNNTDSQLVNVAGWSGVLRTPNGGGSWVTANNGLPPGVPVNAVAADPARDELWAAVDNRSLFKSTGGGPWSYAGTPISSPVNITFDRAANAMYVATIGEVFTSTDAGVTWASQNIRGNFVRINAVAAHGSTLFAGIDAGYDGFALKVDTDPERRSGLAYSTFLGGSASDSANSIAVDAAGHAVVAAAGSVDFPVTSGGSLRAPTIVIKLNATGSAFDYATRLGPGPYSFASGVGVDSLGAAYLVGSFDDDNPRVWIARLDAAGVPTDEYFIDGTTSYQFPAADWGGAIAVGAPGQVYVTGSTNASDYPTTPGAPQPFYGSGASDAIISKVSFGVDTPPSGRNLALSRPAVASSIEGYQYAAVKAVDGITSTRWSSQFSDPQWIYVDLGQRTNVSAVRLTWETASAADYLIQVSDDATNWTTIRNVTNASGGVNDLGVTGSGRYLRIYGTRRNTAWGYSLWELEVYGTPDSAPPPPEPGENLLTNPGFEASVVPATSPGWVSDTYRQSPARSETAEPHGGARNGACRTTTALDCGLYQDLTAPLTASFMFRLFANADRPGALVGVNVNGVGVASDNVEVGAAGNYQEYAMELLAHAGDTIRVWIYSPAVPGAAVIDDASLSVSHVER